MSKSPKGLGLGPSFRGPMFLYSSGRSGIPSSQASRLHFEDSHPRFRGRTSGETKGVCGAKVQADTANRQRTKDLDGRRARCLSEASIAGSRLGAGNLYKNWASQSAS